MAFTNQASDNTFFIESDEPNHRHMNIRDAAKIIARNKQEMIANELSRLACEEYLEDIMQHMRHMEVSKPLHDDGQHDTTEKTDTSCRTKRYRMPT